MGISTSRLCDRRAYRGRIDGEYRMRAPSVASRSRTRGYQRAEPQPALSFLDTIEIGDAAQMDQLGDRDTKFHPVDDIDAAGHEHRASTGRRLQRHCFRRALRAVQPK